MGTHGARCCVDGASKMPALSLLPEMIPLPPENVYWRPSGAAPACQREPPGHRRTSRTVTAHRAPTTGAGWRGLLSSSRSGGRTGGGSDSPPRFPGPSGCGTQVGPLLAAMGQPARQRPQRRLQSLDVARIGHASGRAPASPRRSDAPCLYDRPRSARTALLPPIRREVGRGVRWPASTLPGPPIRQNGALVVQQTGGDHRPRRRAWRRQT